MEVILIACCKTKRPGGSAAYAAPALQAYLPPAAWSELLQARRRLGELQGLIPGPDLGGAAGAPVRCLPAYERYAGQMYERADFRSLYPPAQGRKVLIVSALYGLLDAGDPIRDYDLMMAARLPNGPRLSRWWKEHGLADILEEALRALRPTVVHDLLSGDYHRALGQWPPASLRRGGVAVTAYEYPGKGTGSQCLRGDDLRRLLGGPAGSAHEMGETAGARESVEGVGSTATEPAERTMTLGDKIRRYAVVRMVEPARRRGERTITIRASEIAGGMGLEGRYPSICAAIDSERFRSEARVELVQRQGPARSSSVTWTFKL
jgi:hypothetical protein